MKVRKEIRTVEFKCSNHMRTAKLSLSEMGMDEIFCVRPLAPGWSNSNIILPNTMAKAYYPKNFIMTSDIVNLRWFDGGGSYGTNPKGSELSEDGFMSMKVELTYTSKQLDREDKLELLGVR